MKKKFALSLVVLYTLLFYVSTTSASGVSELYKTIEEYKLNNDFKGVDARCDTIYHLVPGIKSKTIDLQQSYDVMKLNNTFNTKELIYEISDTITIDELDCGPIYMANEEKEEVSLIINVAWGEEYIPEMLDTLDKYNVKANFFIEGVWAYKNMDLVFEIHTRGHLIGNHSYSHADFMTLSKEEAFAEISKTNYVLESITNEKIKYFGPPSGSYKEETVELTNSINMKTIMWSIDTIDWQKPSSSVIEERVLSKLHNGAIVLMHPTENTKDALNNILLGIESYEYNIVRLNELLY